MMNKIFTSFVGHLHLPRSNSFILLAVLFLVACAGVDDWWHVAAWRRRAVKFQQR